MDDTLILLGVIGMFASFMGTLAGGQAIITLPGMILLGIPIHTSIATNKFSNGFACLTSILYLWKKGTLEIKTIYMHICIAFVGGGLGAFITSSISDKALNIIALCLLVLALFVAFKQKQWIEKAQTQYSKSWRFRNILLFLISVYDGGFGPGSSTFSILHFMNQGNTYVKAAQLTRVLIFGSCLGAFIVFYKTGVVHWPYAIAMALGSALGSQIGILALPHIPFRVAHSLMTLILFFLVGQMVFKLV